MRLLIFSGFLGSGKTTMVQKVIRALDARGEKVAVIENEIGKIGIDPDLISKTGIRVTPLFGGCVCCQISGDLLVAVNAIRDEVNPDWIVIELTGLATLVKTIELFQRYGDPAMPIHTIAVVDASRWEVLYKIATPLIESQLTGAGLVVVNKIDVRQPTADMFRQMKALAPDAHIVQISANAISNKALLDQMEESFV